MSSGSGDILVAPARNCVLPVQALYEEIIVLSVYSFLQVTFLSWHGRKWALSVTVVLTGGFDNPVDVTVVSTVTEEKIEL